MSQSELRIEQSRKMAAENPDDELAHFRLGQLLMEAGQHAEAITPLERTVVLSPDFSKAYQFLGDCYIKTGDKERAVEVLTRGHRVADQRGDRMPRGAIEEMLRSLGAEVPASQGPAGAPAALGPGDFPCQCPNHRPGAPSQQLPRPPLPDELGERVRKEICASCWQAWFGDYSIKVINEFRLDLSREEGQQEYDRHLRGFFGFEDE